MEERKSFVGTIQGEGKTYVGGDVEDDMRFFEVVFYPALVPNGGDDFENVCCGSELKKRV